MFTGIIEETGKVLSVKPSPASVRLELICRVTARGLKRGDSLAVNGCCLTVLEKRRKGTATVVSFDLLKETWTRTNLQFLSKDCPVNLERAMALGDRMGGHFVTGHVDGVGRITRWEKSGRDHVLEVKAPSAIRNLLIQKGSIAVDGISLTVAALTAAGFRVWIIPHTLHVTNLGHHHVGDAVNLESDILGKYAKKLLAANTA